MNLDVLFFKNLFDAVKYQVGVYDHNGQLVYYNKAFEKHYLSPMQIGNPVCFQDILCGEYQNFSCLKEAICHQKPVFSQKGNGVFGISVSCVPFLDSSGETYFAESIFHLPKTSLFSLHSDSIPPSTESMILSDKKMKPVLETINRISNFDSTILITGESGTGKTMLAKYIHSKSKRAKEPFITINCAAIPENLIESELFGYVSGAFTGARQKGKIGMVELAEKGTLFLDEIGLLPFHLQAKFLQLVQEKTYFPIGAVKSKTVDVRIISATNLNLEKQVLEGSFREDLYYRLRVIEFHMPPLRERPDAIEPLIAYFLAFYNRKYHIEKKITKRAKELLERRNWSGNIRELQYVMERLIVTSAEEQITSEDIPPMNGGEEGRESDKAMESLNFDEEVEKFEKKILIQAYAKYKSTYKIADALGMTQSKVSRLLRKYNIS